MKIVEALKEFKLLEARMSKNAEQIREYSSVSNYESPAFGTPDAQRKQVESLVQSNMDLAKRYESLKRSIAKTNATVVVVIEGESKTISEWLTFKRHTAPFVVNTFQSLTTTGAAKRLQQSGQQVTFEQGVKIERMYDEEARNRMLDQLNTKIGKIESTLEIVNATTDLVEE